MATPSRKLIIDNLKTVLESITVGNGYKSTIKTVEVLAKTWLQTPEVVRPWLGIVPQETTYQHLPAGRVRSILKIDIIGHVANGSYAQKRERLANLLDDIFAAVNVIQLEMVMPSLQRLFVQRQTRVLLKQRVLSF